MRSSRNVGFWNGCSLTPVRTSRSASSPRRSSGPGQAHSAPTKTARLVENFLRPLTVAEFTSSDAATYAQVRAKLERAGTPIGPLDTLIAAQALARELKLVSSNEREFGRVSGLAIENWARG
jgi:tRNA(fMet)-specific endonuclease VapC